MKGPEYAKFLDCVHCGLCTSACPTYLETGDENNSPRGRIHLMRAVEEGRIELSDEVQSHLDLCLDCRACETACPSGVQYGRLIEPFRATHGHSGSWLQNRILNNLFPSRKLLAVAFAAARLTQRTGLDRLATKLGLLKLAPAFVQRMHRILPPIDRPEERHPQTACTTNQPVARVGLFIGCVADGLFRSMHHATRRVLLAHGCEVVTPSAQACCGAISYHGSAPESAIGYIEKNLAAFDFESLDAIVINVAGCGAMLKELPEIVRELDPDNSRLHATCDAFSAKVKDVSEFLISLPPVEFDQPVEKSVVYHGACHLQHAQRVREAPEELLSRVAGLQVFAPDESTVCCGAAGSYNLTEPEMAARLGRRKLDRLMAASGESRLDAIVSPNVGCTLHLAAELRDRGVDVPIVHPVQLLDEAISPRE